MPDLRKPFVDNLVSLLRNDSDIIFLTGDLGYNFVEPFIKEFPKNFVNCGCIEQSMIDIAVGLALGGKKPYVYSVINFLIFRAYEQVRNDVAYQNANVKLIGVRGKESYKFLGFSHNIADDEDIKVLKGLPNLRRYIPDNEETLKQYMVESYNDKCPSYIRL